MLIRKLPLQEIMSVSQTPAEIYRIMDHSDGTDSTIFYNVYVTVDMTLAMQRDAYNLSVVAKEVKEDKALIPTKVSSAKKWNKATKSLERSVRALAEISSKNVITQKMVDLTSYVSNDLTNFRLGTVPTRAQANSISSQSSLVTLVDPFTASESLISRPTTPGVISPVSSIDSSLQLSTTVNQGIQAPSPPQATFSLSAVSQKIDPASITVSSVRSLGNTASKSLVSNAINLVMSPAVNLPRMPVFRVAPQKKLIKFTLQVKKKRMTRASSFQLILELEDTNGVPVDDLKLEIPHAKIYNTFVTPSSAPSIEAEYIKPGVISVRTAAPKDKKARVLKVFRRLSAPTSGGTDFGTPWSEVFRCDITDNNENIFKDHIATSRPVMYRAVVYGENFKPSEKFSSTVVLPLPQFKAKQTGSLTAIPALSLSGKNVFVEVKVKDIPNDVVSIMVRRYNLTNDSFADKKSSKGPGFVYIGSNPARQTVSTVSIGPEGAVTFRDIATRNGKTYSYVPIGITKVGKQIVGSSAILEIPLSPSRAQVSIDVGSPKLVSSNLDSMEVEFKLSAKFTDFGFSEVRRNLSAGGQKDLFDRNLLEDRDKFEKLISFLVERRNSKTGEEESFGVITGESFSDNAQLRKSSNVKNLLPGEEYTYTFTALLNTPETLFPELAKKDTDVQTLLSFSRKVAKFQNNLSLIRATLKSTSRQKDVTKPSPLEPSDPLVTGRTSVQQSIEFRVPTKTTGKNSFRVEKYRGFNRIVWYAEDVDNIDHFKIFVVSSGGRVLIDTVHCDDASSEFYYRHYQKGFGVNFRYVVQPVDLSYENMSPIQSSTIKAVTIEKFIGISSLTSKIKRL